MGSKAEIGPKLYKLSPEAAWKVYRLLYEFGNLRSENGRARVPALLGLGTLAGILAAACAPQPPAIVEPVSPPEQKPARMEVFPLPTPDTPDTSTPKIDRPVKVETKPEIRAPLRLDYTVRPGDSLWTIAKTFGTTVKEIQALNPAIKDPRLIQIGDQLVIPEVSVEKTVEFLQDLQRKVNEIYQLRRERVGTGTPYVVQKGDTLSEIAERHRVSIEKILGLNPEIKNPNLIFPGQKLRMPEDVIPSQALGEIFGQVEEDRTRLQNFPSPVMAQEIMLYWNTVPGKDEKVKEPEVIVDPQAENGQWIAGQIRDFLKRLPRSGRLVGKIIVEQRKNWPNFIFDAGIHTYSDKPAVIHVFEYRVGPSIEVKLGGWTEQRLLEDMAHEVGHAASLYGAGYNLRFMTPAEVIDLVLKDTGIWDEVYRAGSRGKKHVTWDTEEEEVNADFVGWMVALELNDPVFRYIDPDILQRRRNFFNRLFSAQLEANIDLQDF